MSELNGPYKGRFLLRLPPTGVPQKLIYLQLDLIHSSPSLSHGNLTKPDVLCMHLQLVGNPCIFMPLPLSNSQMPAKYFGGTSTSGNRDPTTLMYSGLVATTAGNVNCNPICLAEAGGPTFTITLSSNTTPLKEEIDYADMSPVWQSIQDRGISEAAAKLIMASWGDRTKKQYSTYLTKWQKFCNQRQISHIQPSVVSVLDFLTLLYQQGLTYSAINTARSALSSYITLENGTCVGKHPLVSRLMKGIIQEKPPRPKYTEIRDVSIVLSYLQSLSAVDRLSLKELTLKLLVLILLVSGQ